MKSSSVIVPVLAVDARVVERARPPVSTATTCVDTGGKPGGPASSALASRPPEKPGRARDEYLHALGPMLPFAAVSTPLKVAIVTGAGTGIGRAVALGLLERATPSSSPAGARRCWSRRSQRPARTATRALAVPTDVADPASVRALFAATRDAFGRLDLLFNNAGISDAGRAARGVDRRAVEVGGRRQPDRRVSLHAAGRSG